MTLSLQVRSWQIRAFDNRVSFSPETQPERVAVLASAKLCAPWHGVTSPPCLLTSLWLHPAAAHSTLIVCCCRPVLVLCRCLCAPCCVSG